MATAAALVIHDLKNELGALEAALQALALAPAPPPQAAAAAHRQCQLLRQRLVMFLALYGGADALRARCEDESPLQLLQCLAARHQRPPPAPSVSVTAVVGALPSYWYLDRRLVELALDAALHNALRVARSRVALGMRVEEGELVLSVEDDGPGLGADTAAPDRNATGLGTLLCRAVAQAHGSKQPDGGVRLFNRPPGAEAGTGARFELWLAT